MKKIMKVFVFVAVAAMALVSCNKQEIENPNQAVEYVFLLGHDGEDTRATLGESSVVWESGDKLGTFTPSGNNNYSSISLGDEFATVSVYANNGLAKDDKIYCYYPYNSEAGKSSEAVNLNIPTTQNGSDGKDAMPMASLPFTVKNASSSSQTEYAGEIKMANLASVIEFHVYSESTEYQSEKVKSVTFNAEQVIAGNFTFDLTAVDYSKKETLNISGYEAKTVVSTISTPVTVSANKDAATVVKMVVAPGSYTGNVVVTTDKANYTYPISTAKEFKRSGVKPLGVNLKAENRIEVDNTGLYAVVALRKSEGYYYYMTNQDAGASTKRLTATVVGTQKPTDGVTLPSTKLWNVTKNGDTYTLKSFDSGQYVSWTSGNSAVMSDDALQFNIEEAEGKYKFSFAAQKNETETETRYLGLNSTKGNNYFAAYTSSENELYLIPAIEGEEVQPTVESIEIANYTTTFTQDEDFVYGGTVTAQWSNGIKTDVTTYASFSGYDMNKLGEQEVTVTYEGKTATYNITVVEKPAEVNYYVKVTSAPADWSGTYLIVYETTPAYWDGALVPGTSSGQMGTTAGMVKTTITDGKIKSSSSVDKSVITIAKSGTGYSLKAASGSYMGMSTNNNGLKSSTNATDYVHTITLESDNTVSILSSDGYTKVAYNKSSSFFRYYKVTTVSGSPNSYPLPCLYRLESANDGGETPEPEQPTLTPRNLAFSSTTANATVGQAFTVPTLSGVTTGVTYSSSNTAVATVNASTGAVTLVGAGSTTIKASALATDQYEAGEASYTLTVSAAQGGGSTGGYTLITDLSQITSGEYVIAAKVNNKYYAMSNITFTSKINGTEVTVSNNTIAKSAATFYVVTITKSGSSYTIQSGGNYLTYTGSSTNLGSARSAYNWTIAEGTNGTFRFTSATSSRGLVFRAGTNNQFGGYALSNVKANGTEYYDVELFKLN